MALSDTINDALAKKRQKATATLSFCRIRGYISIVKKNDLHDIDTIVAVFSTIN
jgi:hypothetical protein